MRIRTLTGVALLAFAVPVLGASPTEAQQPLTLEEAGAAMDAAEAEARQNGWNLAIVVVDGEGVPIYLRRMAGATTRNYEVAMGKVRTALASGMHTGEYAQALTAGTVEEVADGITFEGGYLLRRGGEVVGAMSASGATGAEDAEAVRAGMAAIGIEP